MYTAPLENHHPREYVKYQRSQLVMQERHGHEQRVEDKLGTNLTIDGAGGHIGTHGTEHPTPF